MSQQKYEGYLGEKVVSSITGSLPPRNYIFELGRPPIPTFPGTESKNDIHTCMSYDCIRP